MGLYINPENGQDRIEFLNENGTLITSSYQRSAIDFGAIDEDNVLVCAVDNIAFVAAAVAYNEALFKEYDEPDRRAKYWYIIDKEIAKRNSNREEWNNCFGTT